MAGGWPSTPGQSPHSSGSGQLSPNVNGGNVGPSWGDKSAAQSSGGAFDNKDGDNDNDNDNDDDDDDRGGGGNRKDKGKGRGGRGKGGRGKGKG